MIHKIEASLRILYMLLIGFAWLIPAGIKDVPRPLSFLTLNILVLFPKRVYLVLKPFVHF